MPPTPDLDRLIASLEVEFVALSKCSVGKGYRLDLAGAVDAPGIHYNLAGTGLVRIANEVIDLTPHTLIIVPPRCPFKIEAGVEGNPLQVVDARAQSSSTDGVRAFAAGETEPEIILICGYFRATYGASMQLFERVTHPIVEQFTADHGLDEKLKSALVELHSGELGSRFMSSALLKQVIVTLIRRSQTSLNLWAEQIAMLMDPSLARAFAAMAADPGHDHTVDSLAAIAHLSRSAFMARFAGAFGQPPMTVLRALRMREAARQLGLGLATIEQIAFAVGYESRSSFVRAFRKAYGCEPSQYRGTGNSAYG